jgi:cysteine desulfurase
VTKSTVYLDSFSTTALAPEVRDAMLTAWREPANAGSPHSGGARAAEILDDARAAVAGLIGANPSEIVFTSGATEANNLVIFGVAGAAIREGIPRRRIVVSAIEHKSVQESARALIDYGFELIEAPVCHSGQVDLEEIARLITENTLLVSVMAANNEIGVIQPINKIAGLARSSGAFFHCDAAQAVGKIPVNVFDFDVDYLSISAHKMHGPCGVGALFIASDALRPHPILFGGGQEGGLRSGTVPVPLVAGFGAAACLARSRLVENSQHAETLSEQMVTELLAHQVKFSHVPSEAVKLPGSLTLCFHGVDADSLVEILARDVHVSTGSACTSGQIRTSHVLKSIGISDDMARSVIRMLFGRYNNSEDVRKAALLISIAIKKAGLATGGINQ